eukprot:TRINITY_DN3163_c0_g2_i8.p1 TRINITY_DN3163_c0_g2~~TRINITY_DN3163_c0_g2_i8.p1  ORF type:complete len:1058 (+),score=343.97 TRINITY_DN3163_c0_g2_i8:104-3277(+)
MQRQGGGGAWSSEPGQGAGPAAGGSSRGNPLLLQRASSDGTNATAGGAQGAMANGSAAADSVMGSMSESRRGSRRDSAVEEDAAGNKQIAAIRMQLHISDAELTFCRSVFQAFDVDGSGTIDLEELGRVMQGLGVMMTREQLQELLHQVDVDGSDEVDFGEFLQLIALYKEASQYMFFDVPNGESESLTQIHVRGALSKGLEGLLVPDARYRWVWNCAIMVTVMWFAIWTPHINMQYDYDPGSVWPGLIYLHLCFTGVLVADMVMSSRTVRLELDADATGLEGKALVGTVRKSYLRTWFIPDLLSSFPFELLHGTPLRYLSWCRLLRVCKMPWLWQFSNRTLIDELFIRFHFGLMPLITIVWWLVLLIHFAVEIVTYLQKDREGDFTYVEGIYLVIYTISTVGYGDVDTQTTALRLFCCVLFVASMMINGLVIGQITNTLAKADIRNERKDKMRQTLAVMKYFEIPRQLKDEILQFQFHVLEHNLGAAYNDLLQGLPQPMQEHLGLYVKMKFISMVKMFQAAHRGCQIALAQALVSVVCSPEQYIIVVGEEGREMYFLGHGFADVIAETGAYIATLKKGGHFGELALLDDVKRSASVKALTYCDLFKLDKANFELILNKFPAFRKIVEEFSLARKREQQEAEEKLRQTSAEENTRVKNLRRLSGGQPGGALSLVLSPVSSSTLNPQTTVSGIHSGGGAEAPDTDRSSAPANAAPASTDSSGREGSADADASEDSQVHRGSSVAVVERERTHEYSDILPQPLPSSMRPQGMQSGLSAGVPSIGGVPVAAVGTTPLTASLQPGGSSQLREQVLGDTLRGTGASFPARQATTSLFQNQLGGHCRSPAAEAPIGPSAVRLADVDRRISALERTMESRFEEVLMALRGNRGSSFGPGEGLGEREGSFTHFSRLRKGGGLSAPAPTSPAPTYFAIARELHNVPELSLPDPMQPQLTMPVRRFGGRRDSPSTDNCKGGASGMGSRIPSEFGPMDITVAHDTVRTPTGGEHALPGTAVFSAGAPGGENYVPVRMRSSVDSTVEGAAPVAPAPTEPRTSLGILRES